MFGNVFNEKETAIPIFFSFYSSWNDDITWGFGRSDDIHLFDGFFFENWQNTAGFLLLFPTAPVPFSLERIKEDPGTCFSQ